MRYILWYVNDHVTQYFLFRTPRPGAPFMISIYENSPNPIGLGSMKISQGPRTPHPLQNTRTPMAVRIFSSSATSLLPRLWLGLRLKLRLYFSPGMIVTLRLDHSGAWLGFTICAFSVMHFFFLLKHWEGVFGILFLSKNTRHVELDRRFSFFRSEHYICYAVR